MSSPLVRKWIIATPAVNNNPPVGATLYADIYTMKISGSVKVTPFNSNPGGVYSVSGSISVEGKDRDVQLKPKQFKLTGYLLPTEANPSSISPATPALVIIWDQTVIGNPMHIIHLSSTPKPYATTTNTSL